MDPNETLRMLREAVTTLQNILDDTDGNVDEQGLQEIQELAFDMARDFESLDNWMSGKGFAPDDWR